MLNVAWRPCRCLSDEVCKDYPPRPEYTQRVLKRALSLAELDGQQARRPASLPRRKTLHTPCGEGRWGLWVGSQSLSANPNLNVTLALARCEWGCGGRAHSS